MLSVIAILADEFDEAVDGLLLWDILLDTLLGFIKRYLTTTCAYVTVVGIGHLTRTIHNTTHDTNLQTHEILRGSLDLGNGLLKIVERTATTRTGDIFGLGKLDSCSLKNAISKVNKLTS